MLQCGILGRGKEPSDSFNRLGGPSSRDACRPSFVFGIIEPICGMVLFFQTLFLCAQHCSVAFTPTMEIPAWVFPIGKIVPLKDARGCSIGNTLGANMVDTTTAESWS